MQAAFHQQLALAFMDQLHRLGGGRLAMRDIDDLEPADVEVVLSCDGLDLAAGPTRNRNDQAGLRRLNAPRSERLVARMHDDRVRPPAPAWRERSGDRISRELAPDSDRHRNLLNARAGTPAMCGEPSPSRHDSLADPTFAAAARRPALLDAEQLGNTLPTSAASPVISPRAFRTHGEHAKASRRASVGRQQAGNGRERRLLVDQQHEELLAHEGLELRQCQPRLVVLDGPQCAGWPQAPLVDALPAPCPT